MDRLVFCHFQNLRTVRFFFCSKSSPQVYVRRRNMCRLACNVCGVTTVYGSSVGSSSCCRLSTRCSLSVISLDRPSTAGVLAFFWMLHVLCLDYHQPICVSVGVGRKRQFTKSHHIFFLPKSTAVCFLLHGITPASVDGCPLCRHLPGCTYNITNILYPLAPAVGVADAGAIPVALLRVC